MPFNGSGTYVRVSNWSNDAANNLPISATKFDNDGNDVATALSLCLTRDGQGAPSAPLTWTQPLTLSRGSDGAELTISRTGGANNPSLAVSLADATGVNLNLAVGTTLGLQVGGTNVIALQ